jgi:hypothetical protein
LTDTLTSIEPTSTPGSEKRRSSRVPLAVPITVSGVDALGEPFRELTTTLSVSCNGCKYKSKNYVQRDSLVTVELAHTNPRLSPRVVRGRARWVQRPRNLREQYEIGLELVVSGNIWGLQPPPPDWFPHPDDEVPGTAQPEDAAEIAPIALTADPSGVAASDFETQDEPADATGTKRSVSAHTFEEIDLSGAIGFTPEESEPAPPPGPIDFNTRLQETIATSLKSMVDRMAEAAALDIATRIAAVVDEARAACDTAGEEFEEKIRGALDAALDPEQANALADSIEKQAKRRARKASKRKARQAEDADSGSR